MTIRFEVIGDPGFRSEQIIWRGEDLDAALSIFNQTVKTIYREGWTVLQLVATRSDKSQMVIKWFDIDNIPTAH